MHLIKWQHISFYFQSNASASELQTQSGISKQISIKAITGPINNSSIGSSLPPIMGPSQGSNAGAGGQQKLAFDQKPVRTMVSATNSQKKKKKYKTTYAQVSDTRKY